MNIVHYVALPNNGLGTQHTTLAIAKGLGQRVMTHREHETPDKHNAVEIKGTTVDIFDTKEEFKALAAGADYFHYHWWHGVSLEPFVWAKELELPTIVTLHDAKPFLWEADYYIVESKAHNRYITPLLPERQEKERGPDKWVCIPAGYDPSRIVVKQDYSIKGKPKVVQLCAMHGKAAPDIVSIMRRGMPPDVEMHFIGWGRCADQFQARAQNDPRIVFHKHVPDATSKLAEFDVFFYHSQFETCGLVVSEALAAGLPVVCSPNDVFGRVLTADWNGIYSHPGDFPDAITWLLGNDEKRRELGMTAARWARYLSSQDDMIAAHARFYEAVENRERLYWGLPISGAETAGPGMLLDAPIRVFHRYRQIGIDLPNWLKHFPKQGKPEEKLIWCDLGSGSAWQKMVMDELHPGVFEYHGLDLCREHVEHAKEQPDTEVILGDIRDLPYSDGYADLVTCCETIEHVKEGEKAIEEMVRILKPGGMLWVSTPNHPDHWHEHVRFYTAVELSNVLRKEGLVVVGHTYQRSDGIFNTDSSGDVFVLAALKLGNKYTEHQWIHAYM